VLWVLLAAVPAVFIVFATALAPGSQVRLTLVENGRQVSKVVDLAFGAGIHPAFIEAGSDGPIDDLADGAADRAPRCQKSRPPDNALPPGGLLWEASAVCFTGPARRALLRSLAGSDVSMETTGQARSRSGAGSARQGSCLPG
jgi:hypothetical protein